MRHLILSFGCVLLLVAGCQEPVHQAKGVKVIIEEQGEFPHFLAGRWVDDEEGWEFVFEEDGSITSAVIDRGFIEVVPSKGIATKPMRRGGQSVYELGQWTIEYSPQSRELTVDVVVEHFHIDMKPSWLEGHSRDLFFGPVSEEELVWRAEWISFPKYVAYTPEPGELHVDPNETITKLVFRKVNE